MTKEKKVDHQMIEQLYSTLEKERLNIDQFLYTYTEVETDMGFFLVRNDHHFLGIDAVNPVGKVNKFVITTFLGIFINLRVTNPVYGENYSSNKNPITKTSESSSLNRYKNPSKSKRKWPKPKTEEKVLTWEEQQEIDAKDFLIREKMGFAIKGERKEYEKRGLIAVKNFRGGNALKQDPAIYSILSFFFFFLNFLPFSFLQTMRDSFPLLKSLVNAFLGIFFAYPLGENLIRFLIKTEVISEILLENIAENFLMEISQRPMVALFILGGMIGGIIGGLIGIISQNKELQLKNLNIKIAKSNCKLAEIRLNQQIKTSNLPSSNLEHKNVNDFSTGMNSIFSLEEFSILTFPLDYRTEIKKLQIILQQVIIQHTASISLWHYLKDIEKQNLGLIPENEIAEIWNQVIQTYDQMKVIKLKIEDLKN